MGTMKNDEAGEETAGNNNFLWHIRNQFEHWAEGPGKEFILSQAKIFGVLAIASIGNNWEPCYPRNDNHNMTMFWIMNAGLAVAAAATWKHTPKPSRVVLLSRDQTEEWKGWMQWAFIMYHYYRAWSAYNWIRVFVSSYVWMTGFGNFLYFDKTKDFSINRIVSMCIRINYFPFLLAFCMGVSLDLYYVVPLHTEGFFMTMITCYIGQALEIKCKMTYWKSRIGAIVISAIAHILFFETSAVKFLLLFSDELHFRFQADKYSALIGIVCGLLMKKANQYMAWVYAGEGSGAGGGHVQNPNLDKIKWAQRAIGLLLICFWYGTFGKIQDKYTYNPVHPFIFYLPLLGWLMIRNSSRWLTESHSTFLEFLGRNTLETYVLQFHVFMNHDVQFIPVIIPGSTATGPFYLKVANMLLCGVIFLVLSVQARKITVSTQETVGELVKLLQVPKGYSSAATTEEDEVEMGKVDTAKVKDAEKNDETVKS